MYRVFFIFIVQTSSKVSFTMTLRNSIGSILIFARCSTILSYFSSISSFFLQTQKSCLYDYRSYLRAYCAFYRADLHDRFAHSSILCITSFFIENKKIKKQKERERERIQSKEVRYVSDIDLIDAHAEIKKSVACC